MLECEAWSAITVCQLSAKLYLFTSTFHDRHCLKCTVFYEIRSKVATQFVTWDHTPRSNQLPPLRAGMVLEFFLGHPRYHKSLTWKFQDCTATFDSVYHIRASHESLRTSQILILCYKSGSLSIKWKELKCKKIYLKKMKMVDSIPKSTEAKLH